MLDVSDFNKVVFDSTSKGNQIKFFHPVYQWIKLDSPYYIQGLAENFVSCFEDTIVGFNHVEYESIVVKYEENVFNACTCKNMYGRDVQFISLRQLFKQNNIPLSIFINSKDIAENIVNVIDTVYNITGLNIMEYLRDNLFLDALILNEDRHTMNLGVCYYQDKYYTAPVFDNGSSLFCVNWTYRKKKSFLENIEAAKSAARPFSKFHDKQIDALIRLGIKPLNIDFNKLQFLLNNYENPIYDVEKVDMIKKVLKNRLDYYVNQGVYIYV